MKNVVLLFAIVFLGCSKTKISKKTILGSWQMTNVINPAGIDLSDRTTFFKNDSISVEAYLDGKLGETYSLKYELDTISNTIEFYQEKKTGRKFQIVKLTRTELDIKDPITGKIVKNKRIN